MNPIPPRALRLFATIAMSFAFVAAPCLSASAAKPQKTQTSKNKNKKTTSTRRNAGKNSSGPKTSAEAKRLQEAAQQDIRQTKEKIRLNDQEIKEGLADLNQLSAEIKSGKAKVTSLQGKVSSLQNEITTLNGNIAKNEAELQRMRDEYLKAVKKMRLNQKNQSTLAFIFASKNFNQALRRMRYIRQFSQWKETKSREINTMIDQLGNEKTRLASAQESYTASLSQLSATQRELEAKHGRQQRLVEGLRQNGAALQSHLTQKQNEANRLRESIANLIAQEQAKAEAERAAREKAAREAREKAAREKAEAERLAQEKAKAEQQMQQDSEKDKKKEKEQKKKEKKKKDKTARNKKKKEKDTKKGNAPANEAPRNESNSAANTAAAKAAATTSNFASLRGRLPRPVDGDWRITNPFGRHSMPELPDVVYDNPGIDAEVAKGASVKAVAGGKVSGVYKVQGYGSVVIVNHGDYYTVYGNLSSVAVSVGSQLSAGSKVGSAAADPDDQRRGSVHFELWKGREKQNPESWLR